jgi:alanyl aminopeptidase
MQYSRPYSLLVPALFAVLGPQLAASASDQQPKLRLPKNVAPVSYQGRLTLDPQQDTFTGSIAIKAQIKQPTRTIWLNGSGMTFQSASVSAQGKTWKARTAPGGDDFMGLEFDRELPIGPAEISIEYTGHIRGQDSSGIFRMEDDGRKYLFTQFESTDARAAFPCFDEPSYKVPWQLTLDVPESQTAISNTPAAKEETRQGRHIISFAQTKPLPSYLLAFAVGEFDFVDSGTAGRNHIPVRIVTPKGHAAEAKYAAEVTATILTRLEDYFGIPYPYEKSDNLAIPVTFGFGAMENAGLVTYAQTLILAKPDSDTTRRQREYASVAAHELAHQWFGDLVTTAWWDDIWLNEAFATWMEQKLIAEWKPEWKTRVEDVDSKLLAERQDSLVTARKVRQEIKTKDDISNAFDSITYQKGAAVIGMFESWVGPESFRKGVQNYLKQYAFRTATAPEFLDSVSSVSNAGLSSAFSTFLNQAGVPLLSMALQCTEGSASIRLEQQRFLPLGSKGSSGQQWQVPVCVRYGSGNQSESECTVLKKPVDEWKLRSKACPTWVEGNSSAVGYYRVDYKDKLLSALTSGDVEKRLSAEERVDLMGNAAALSNAGKLSAADALQLVETFHSDPERYVVESALDIALSPQLHLVEPRQLPNYQRFLQKNFQARARELGWIPRPDEDDNIRLLRPKLLRAVATQGADEALAKEARELADKWLNDQNALDPNLVAAVLATAAYWGDNRFAESLLAELKKIQDRQQREQIIRAMAEFRDKAAIETNMKAVLAGHVPFMEGLFLLFAGQGQESTRNLAFDFMKIHFEEISKKRPTGGGFDAGALFPQAGISFCDARSRDQLKNFFEPKANQFTGAPRALANVLERIDVCIAEKAEQQQSIASFLQRY